MYTPLFSQYFFRAANNNISYIFTFHVSQRLLYLFIQYISTMYVTHLLYAVPVQTTRRPCSRGLQLINDYELRITLSSLAYNKSSVNWNNKQIIWLKVYVNILLSAIFIGQWSQKEIYIYVETWRCKSRNISKQMHCQYSYIWICVFYIYLIPHCLLFGAEEACS